MTNVEGYHEFMKYYRSLINVSLKKNDETQKYKDTTISHVLSIKSEDSLLALPNRLIIKTCCFDTPIVSYGCICLVSNGNNESSSKEDSILLIKRRDSVSYIDLIQGNYRTSQLFLLIRDLPNDERNKLINYDFDTLWKDLRMPSSDNSTNSNTNTNTSDSEVANLLEVINETSYNYNYAKSQFNKISPYLKSLFDKFPSLDPEGKGMWGFPKGRPIILNYEEYKTKNEEMKYESPIDCAFREFSEETNGIKLEKYKIIFSDPISELYPGTNNKNYQTHYFVVRLETMPEIKQFEKENTGIRTVTSKECAQIEFVPISLLSNYLRENRNQLCQYIIDKEQTSIETFNEIWKNPVVIADDFTPTI